jgi:hypothetical protein
MSTDWQLDQARCLFRTPQSPGCSERHQINDMVSRFPRRPGGSLVRVPQPLDGAGCEQGSGLILGYLEEHPAREDPPANSTSRPSATRTLIDLPLFLRCPASDNLSAASENHHAGDECGVYAA